MTQDADQLLGATKMVPVHWGTVNLRLGPPSMPRRRLAKVAREHSLEQAAVTLTRILETLRAR